MERPRGFVVRVRDNFCFIRANDAGVATEFYAHASDFADRQIPPVGSEVEFTPCPPKRRGGEFSAEFCKVLKRCVPHD